MSESKTVEVYLPWPWGMSPNSARRGPMSARSGAEAEDREKGRKCADGLGRPLAGVSGDVMCEIVVWPRDYRHYDCLNIHYRLKAMLDGVCDALGLDDYHLNPVAIERKAVEIPGKVLVRLTWRS